MSHAEFGLTEQLSPCQSEPRGRFRCEPVAWSNIGRSNEPVRRNTTWKSSASAGGFDELTARFHGRPNVLRLSHNVPSARALMIIISSRLSTSVIGDFRNRLILIPSVFDSYAGVPGWCSSSMVFRLPLRVSAKSEQKIRPPPSRNLVPFTRSSLINSSVALAISLKASLCCATEDTLGYNICTRPYVLRDEPGLWYSIASTATSWLNL